MQPQFWTRTARVAALFALALTAAPAPEAAALTLSALDSGWYSHTGFHGPTSENYLTGYSGQGYRSFVVFDLSPAVGQTIFAAELRLELPSDGFSSADAAETFALYDVSTPIATLIAGGPSSPAGELTYADLGSGTLYGSLSVSETDEGTIVTIALNGDALAALSLGTGLFAFGGAVTTLSGGLGIEQVFGFTGSDSTRELVLTVPEPGAAALLALGLLGLASGRRRPGARS